MPKEKCTTLVQQLKTLSYCADPIQLYEKLTDDTEEESALFFSENQKNKHYEVSIIAPKMALKVEYRQPFIEITALSQTGQDIMGDLLGCRQKEKKHIIKIDFNKENLLSEDERIKQQGPFDILRKILSLYNKKDSLPNCTKIILFSFSFELINFFEELPLIQNHPSDYPDYIAYLPEKLIVIDHLNKKTHYSVIGSTMEEVNKKIKPFIQKAMRPYPKTPKCNENKKLMKYPVVKPSEDEFKKLVRVCQKRILKGDIFQTVISRQFMTPCPFPFKAFKRLVQTSACEYGFFFKSKDHILFGASPETSLKIEKCKDTEERLISLYPIAGTRPRGTNLYGKFDKENDTREEAALRLSQKELAEHMMLVDLARNDIAKISITGSTHVKILAEIKRYPNVMHMSSIVQGFLKPDLDAFHAYTACMNMGTLSGAPKIMATKILRECEKVTRGAYGGTVGWINCDHQMDSAIIIRSALIHDNTAYVQAGAGIVADSCPHEETQETRYKAQVVLNAIMSEGV